MKSAFLETGQIVNTHGLHGEVRLMPWSDSPEFLLDFKTLYVDGAPMTVSTARVHKQMLLVQFEGVSDVDSAMKLKGKTVSIARKDVQLEPGAFFLADLVGLTVRDEQGQTIGTVKEVLQPSVQTIYVVEGQDGTHMIPAVPEFVKKVDVEGGEMVVALIEGM